MLELYNINFIFNFVEPKSSALADYMSAYCTKKGTIIREPATFCELSFFTSQPILLGKCCANWRKENRKALKFIALRFWEVTPVGLEPTTQWLRVICSLRSLKDSLRSSFRDNQLSHRVKYRYAITARYRSFPFGLHLSLHKP